MTLDMTQDLGLFVWIITALCASITTGSIVGVLLSAPSKTYKLASSVFVGGAVTWVMTSFLGGAVTRFMLEALMMSQFLLFGLLAGLVSIVLSVALVRLDQLHRAIRWSVLGALSAWLAVAIGSAAAYQHLNTNLVNAGMASAQAVLPSGFWPCIMFSMAISTILGACVGGMLFRHRQLWRS
jgi:hypothetical protein